MDASRWEKVLAAFDELVELGAAERASRLATLGAADPDLADAVAALLRADADADAWLARIESPAAYALRPKLHLQARLQTALGDVYRIERALDGGGMSHVFVAEETPLGRRVAIKVLPPERSSGIDLERFERETRIAAQLSHPHIVPVLHAGLADGLVYYTMPFIPGESLRERLRREGPLGLEEALRITREVADALDYAHRAGIVHRDVKPGNILLHEGHTLVADFGIGRAITHAAAPDTITQAGVVVGTPAYMSPEQAAGHSDLDARSDVYSLACVFYETLAGDPPFTGSTARAILARKAADRVPPLRTVREAVPPGVELAVMRALARDPADRFSTAGDFAKALQTAAAARPGRPPAPRRRVIAAGMTAVALAAAASWAFVMQRGDSPAPSSLAVLPCKSTIDDPDKRYLGQVITEDLIAEVSKSRLFDKVIAPASVARYRGTTKQPREIGGELGADALLYCDYRQSGGSERMRVQLVTSRDGALLWAQDFERELSATGAAQLPVAAVSGLSAALGPRHANRRLPTRRGNATSDVGALNLYKEGRYFLGQFHEDAVRRSIVLFRESIARDSAFALPYVGLARAYMVLGTAHGSMHEREAFPLLKEAAERALAVDDRLAEAHALLGEYELHFGWNWPAAERRFRRAIELDPSLASAHEMFAFYLSYLGRHDEAIAASLRAVELNPVDPIAWGDAGVQYMLAGRYEDAVRVLTKGLELAPNFHPDHLAIGAAYVELGDTRRAIDHLRKADSLSGHQLGIRGYLAYAHALAGDSTTARAILRELKREAARLSAPGKLASAIAHVHAGLGERDSAFVWLNVAYEQRSSVLIFDLLGPPSRRLAGDPRHDALLRATKLPARARRSRPASIEHAPATRPAAVPRRYAESARDPFHP